MNFTSWDILTRKYVSQNIKEGVVIHFVDYAGMGSDPLFKEFGQALHAANITGFTKEQHYAFYMNAYNYLAAKTIVDNPCMSDMFYPGCGPLQSIRQVGQQQPSLITTTVWGLRAGTVAGEVVSLDDIENLKLRNPPNGWTEDSRLHACIVCASVSCPDLRIGAFTPQNLSAEMDDQFRSWLANPNKGLLWADGALFVSPIFNWFSGDFAAKSNSTVMNWLINYAPTNVSSYLKEHPNTPLNYMTYNWNLNGEVGKLCPTAPRLCFPWWGLLIVCVIISLIILIIGLASFCKKRRGYSTL